MPLIIVVLFALMLVTIVSLMTVHHEIAIYRITSIIIVATVHIREVKIRVCQFDVDVCLADCHL